MNLELLRYGILVFLILLVSLSVHEWAHARAADVIVAAAGVAHLVRPTWVRPGATVLSVGITRTIEGILGDVHPEVDGVAGKRSGATGGVGAMTRAMLLTNIVEIAERAA